MRGRLISAPSDRVGDAPLWEYFGGSNCPCGKLIWASAPGYGLTVIRMYSQALAASGLAARACRTARLTPASPPAPGYWEVTADSVVHPFGTATFYGDMHAHALYGAADRRRVHVDGDRVLAPRTRRRDLHVRVRALLRIDRRHAPEQADRLDGAHRRQPRVLARRERRRHLQLRRRALLRIDGRPPLQPAHRRHGTDRLRQRVLGVREQRRDLPVRRRAVVRITREDDGSRRRSCRCRRRSAGTATGC